MDGNHGDGVLTEERPAADVGQLERVVHQVPVRDPSPRLWLHTLNLFKYGVMFDNRYLFVADIRKFLFACGIGNPMMLCLVRYTNKKQI